MKKLNLHRIAYIGITASLLLSFSSCWQESRTDAFLKKIPAQSNLVLVGNMKQIIESGGGSLEESHVKLPGYFYDFIDYTDDRNLANDIDAFNDALKEMGVNIETGACYSDDPSQNYGYFLFSLNNPEAFINYIEDNGFVKYGSEDGIVFYNNKEEDHSGFDAIAINGNWVYITHSSWYTSSRGWQPESESDIERRLKNTIKDAEDQSFSSHKSSKFIKDDNAFAAVFNFSPAMRRSMRDMNLPSYVIRNMEGMICIKCKLEGNNIKASAKWFDEAGNEKSMADFASYMNFNGKINTHALSFMSSDIAMLFATCLKDVNWDDCFSMVEDIAGNLSGSEKVTMTVVKSYLEKLDGTIAIGIGIDNGLNSIFDLSIDENTALREVIATAVIELKEGKSRVLMNDLRALLDEGEIYYDENRDGITIILDSNTYENCNVIVENHDNFIVISNRPIHSDHSCLAVKKINHGKYITTCSFALERNNRLMRDLRIDYDICASLMCNATPFSIELTIDATPDGKSSGIVEQVLRSLFSIMRNSDDIQARWEGRYNLYHKSNFREEQALVCDSTVYIVEETVDSTVYN